MFARSSLAALLVLLVSASCEEPSGVEQATNGASGPLALALSGEGAGYILENGQFPTSASPYSVQFRPKFGRYYKGSEFNKFVTEATASINSPVECKFPGTDTCGTFSWFDGFKNPGQGTPNLWTVFGGSS